jgi:succinate dehydrogenase / fumarate reductase iron-sulfur subunit
MKMVFRIKRYDPEDAGRSGFQEYAVDVDVSDRILDVLVSIKHTLDNTLCFRASCAHGVCGSDAMTINGVERLACKTLVRDVAEASGATVTLEPLRCLPVQRDLMVDYSRFFACYRLVKPYLIPIGTPEHGEHIQTPADRAQFDDPTKCILCACCHSACPVEAEKDPDFIGPAAVVQAARFVFDNRDEGIGPRKDVLDDVHGAWACENHFNCTRVCPRGIKVTKNINLVKRKLTAEKGQSH